jgi:hypothetical protein
LNGWRHTGYGVPIGGRAAIASAECVLSDVADQDHAASFLV